VSLDQFFTWFAKGRTYDLVMLDNQRDWRDALDKVRTVFTVAAHDRTVVVLNNVMPPDEFSAPLDRELALRLRAESEGHGEPWHADVCKTVLALHDLHPELDFRTIGTNGDQQTVIWQLRRTVSPRFAGEEDIGALTHADVERHRDLFATVTEDKAMAAVQDWLFPRPTGSLSRLARRVSAWLG
jgi:hypothetical protein